MGLIGDVLKLTCPRPRLLSYGRKSGRKLGRSSVQGIVRRSCSINVDPEQIPGNYLISDLVGRGSLGWLTDNFLNFPEHML